MNKELLETKHGFVIGSEGSGKSTFIRNLIKESSRPCVYITVHNEDFGDDFYITINESSDELKNTAITKIHEQLSKDTSFSIKVAFGYTGQIKGVEYLHDVLTEILQNNKNYTLVIDDAQSMATGVLNENYKETYKKLLEQKIFSVVSVFHMIDDELKYIFDYAEKTYIFKISGSIFRYLEEKGLLTMDDVKVVDQKVGEFIVH